MVICCLLHALKLRFASWPVTACGGVDFPYMLFFAHASDIKLVNRPKMSVFC